MVFMSLVTESTVTHARATVRKAFAGAPTGRPASPLQSVCRAYTYKFTIFFLIYYYCFITIFETNTSSFAFKFFHVTLWTFTSLC